MSAPQQSSKGQAIDAACEDPSSVASAESVTPPPASVMEAASVAAPAGRVADSRDASASAFAPSFSVASQDVLFVESDEPRCDVCGEIVAEDDDLDHASNDYAVSGRGLYVWSRSGETRYEEPPLCPSCASAVGVSALARWEIEEEEG